MTDPTGPSGHDLVHPVILCGGSGARLWPLSRTCRPKQFLALDGRASMLTETAQRLTGPGFAPVTAICSEEHRFLAAEALRNLEDAAPAVNPRTERAPHRGGHRNRCAGRR